MWVASSDERSVDVDEIEPQMRCRQLYQVYQCRAVRVVTVQPHPPIHHSTIRALKRREANVCSDMDATVLFMDLRTTSPDLIRSAKSHSSINTSCMSLLLSGFQYSIFLENSRKRRFFSPCSRLSADSRLVSGVGTVPFQLPSIWLICVANSTPGW